MCCYTMHKFDETQLKQVMKIAKKVGSVQLHAYYDGNAYYILDGVHRTEAAKRLGLPLILVRRNEQEMMSNEFKEYSGRATVEQLIATFHSNGNFYQFSEFVSVKVI